MLQRRAPASWLRSLIPALTAFSGHPAGGFSSVVQAREELSCVPVQTESGPPGECVAPHLTLNTTSLSLLPH